MTNFSNIWKSGLILVATTVYKIQFLWLKTESTQNFWAIRPSSVLVSQ